MPGTFARAGTASHAEPPACTESVLATPGTLHQNASKRHVFLIAIQLLGFHAGFPQSGCSSVSVEQRATHLLPGARAGPSLLPEPFTHSLCSLYTHVAGSARAGPGDGRQVGFHSVPQQVSVQGRCGAQQACCDPLQLLILPVIAGKHLACNVGRGGCLCWVIVVTAEQGAGESEVGIQLHPSWA